MQIDRKVNGMQVCWMAATEGYSIQQLLTAAVQASTQSPSFLEQLKLLQSGRAIALMPDVEVTVPPCVYALVLADCLLDWQLLEGSSCLHALCRVYLSVIARTMCSTPDVEFVPSASPAIVEPQQTEAQTLNFDGRIWSRPDISIQ